MVKAIIAKIKNLAKKQFYIIILLLLSFVFFHNVVSSTKIMSNIHYLNDVAFYSYNMKESLKQGALPLWTPYYYSGRPLFAQPEYYFIDLNFLLVLLTGSIYLAMNFSVIAYLFLAGLGMYFLVLFLSESRKAAFISALIYMFNGFVHTFVVPGNIMIIEGYSLIPFIFLFTIKALKNKDFILNSVIAGLFAAFLIFAGGVIFLPYLFLLILVYSFIYIIYRNISKRILKLGIVGILIFAVAFGVSAVKLLPGLEFMKLSNRGAGLPYEEYLGEPIKLKNFGFAFISNVFLKGEHISAAIGVAGFVLFLFGLYNFRNRLVLFSALTVLLSLLMSSESFLAKILYNVPILNQARHIERSIFLFAFASSILGGFGFLSLQSFIGKYKKIGKNLMFSIVASLVLIELFALQHFPQALDVVKPNDIPILDYMGKDSSMFRTMNLALSTLIGASGYNYYSQLGISEIKGGSGIWFNDYLGYLIAAQNMPAKFWGVLNNKYVVMSQNMSIEGLSYVGEFKPCKDCPIWEAWGPYLYKNTKYLPRYYIVPNSILIVGDNALVKQLIYILMLREWDPKNTVLIEGTNINDYGIDFLKKFNFILLLKDSADQNSIPRLRDYAAQGGVIIPDVLNGKNSISDDDINAIFNKTMGNLTEISAGRYLNNKVVLDLNGERGWLVASERFAYFPGWTANVNGKNVGIFKANNAVTALYLEGSQRELVFEYKPNSYRKGKLISVAALAIIAAYFVYFIYAKFRPGDKNQA